MRPMVFAGLLALLALGAACICALLAVAAGEDPSPPLSIAPEPVASAASDPAAAAAPHSAVRDPAPRAARPPEPQPDTVAIHDFHGVEGVVLKGGRPVAARVELRLLRHTGFASLAGRDGQATGGVLDENRIPFTAARAVTQAGSDGRFRFARLQPGAWEVTAIDTEGRAAVVAARVNHYEPIRRVEIEIPNGAHVLTGRVRLADGRPFLGPVRLLEVEDGTVTAYRPAILPDAEGRFRFDDVGESPVELLAWMPGNCWIRTWTLHMPWPKPLEIVVDAAAKRTVGRVIDNATAEPVVGAKVNAWFRGGVHRAADFVATSDAEGRFSIPAGGKLCGCRADCDGYLTTYARLSGTDREVTVRLLRPAAVAGRVTTEVGAPAAGAEVIAGLFDDADDRYFDKVRRTVADAEGNYRFDDLPPGPVMVAVWGRRWVSPGIETAFPGRYNPFLVEVTAGRAVSNDLSVVPTVPVRGRVVGPKGEPVSGARITAAEGDFNIRSRSPLLSVADEDGRFVLHSPRVPQSFWVAARGYGSRRVEAGTPGDGQAPLGEREARSGEREAPFGEREAGGTRIIELDAVADQWVTVQVVGANEQPVVGARVSWDDACRFDVAATTRTGSDGHCRLGPLPASAGVVNVEVSVDAPGHFPRRRVDLQVKVGDGEVGRLRLEPARVLTGRICWPDGKPAVGVEAEVIFAGDAWSGSRGVSYMQQLRTGADGRFQCQVSHDPQQIDVRFWRDGRIYRASVAPSRKDTVDIVLEMHDPGSEDDGFVARLLDPRGRAVTCASVETFRNKRACSRSAWLDDGVWRLRLDPKDSQRWLMVSGAKADDGRLLGACVQPLSPGAANKFELRLPEARAIEGEVVDADGRPVRGCRVAARYERTEPSQWYPQDHAVTRTDAMGRFRLDGLGPYTYSVCVTASSPADPAPAAVRVPAPAAGVRIGLVRGREFRVRWVCEDGTPVVGLPIKLVDSGGDGREIRCKTDADGAVTFRGVHPFRPHELSTDVGDAAFERFIRYCCDDWKPANTTIRMLESFSISGVVHNAEGGVASGATVWCHDGSRWRSRSADDDGCFSIGELPRGSRRLRVAPDGGSGWWGDAAASEVEVTAGTEHAELTIPPHRVFSVRLVPTPPGDARARVGLFTARPDGTWARICSGVSARGVARFLLPRALQGSEAWIHARVGGRQFRVSAHVSKVDISRECVDVALTPTVGLRVRVALNGGDWSGYRGVVSLNCGPIRLRTWHARGVDGEFVAAGVPPGSWEVKASVKSTQQRTSGRGSDRPSFEGRVAVRVESGGLVTVPVTVGN